MVPSFPPLKCVIWKLREVRVLFPAPWTHRKKLFDKDPDFLQKHLPTMVATQH
jgi:hypothetical protein